MHELLDKYLCKKYPKIFADRHKPMTETCMCWGLTCGDGWLFLINNLCYQIQSRIDNPGWNNEGKIEIPQVVAMQIKEKMGGLRFYFDGGDEYIRGLVGFAESLSYSICEDCGKMDENIGHTKGWIKTCCKEHSDNRIWQNTQDKKLLGILEKIKKEKK